MRLTGGSPGRILYGPSFIWRRKGLITSLVGLVTTALVGTTVVGVPAASASSTENVIVTASGLLSPVTAVADVLGTVLTKFHIINGVEASIPTVLEPLLAALPGITVTPDVSVSVQSTVESTGPHTPSDEFLQQTGATQLFAGGDTGQGVTVAVLDTGIDDLPDFAGRLIGGVDLTGGNNPFQDSFGHGTFVAGLIAGNGASSGGQYEGEAPGADLVSVKVAGATGQTDLATVIEGVQWAVDNQLAYNIRVLNMSLGFQPFESTVVNPLDQAVQAAWNSGIAVVASAGNAGPSNGTVLSPGDDPLVITVGSLDDMAQPVVADDEMTNFSSAGPTSPDGWAKPDLVTSGRSVVSLAAPGSTIYNENPLGPHRLGQLRRFWHIVQHGHHERCGGFDPGRQPFTHTRSAQGPVARHDQPWPGRESLRRRAWSPERERRRHRGPDEPRPVRCRHGADPARGHGFALTCDQLGQHLERKPLVGRLMAAGFGQQQVVERYGVERFGVERFCVVQQGLE